MAPNGMDTLSCVTLSRRADARFCYLGLGPPGIPLGPVAGGLGSGRGGGGAGRANGVSAPPLMPVVAGLAAGVGGGGCFAMFRLARIIQGHSRPESSDS